MRKVRFGVRLRPEQEAALEKIIANDPEETKSRIVRVAIDEYLARHYAPNDAGQIKQKTRNGRLDRASV